MRYLMKHFFRIRVSIVRIISIDTKYNTLYKFAPMKISCTRLQGGIESYEVVS